jgi:hypothetical protein
MHSKALKNSASRRDPALCGSCKCSHLNEYAALSKTPHALSNGMMLVSKHPVEQDCLWVNRCSKSTA